MSVVPPVVQELNEKVANVNEAVNNGQLNSTALAKIENATQSLEDASQEMDVNETKEMIGGRRRHRTRRRRRQSRRRQSRRQKQSRRRR